MSFKIRRKSRIDLIADERLYISADGKEIVKEGDPKSDGGQLLAAAGSIIEPRYVERFGLKPADEPSQTVPPAEIKGRGKRVIDPETR